MKISCTFNFTSFASIIKYYFSVHAVERQHIHFNNGVIETNISVFRKHDKFGFISMTVSLHTTRGHTVLCGYYPVLINCPIAHTSNNLSFL